MTHAPRSTSRPAQTVWVVLGGLLALKMALLAIHGPLYSPDTPGYLQYADRILAGSEWRHSAEIAEQAVPITAMRMIGYPALIAGARSVAGAHFDYLLVVLQTLLSLLAGLFVYRLGLALTRSRRLALTALILTSMTLILLYDLFVLTDSLHCSLMTILFAALAVAWLDGRGPGIWLLLLLGAVFSAACLLRETTVYYIVFVLGLFVVGALRSSWSARRILPAMGTLLLLPAIVLSAYLAWNQHRAGAAFLTCSNATVFLVPMEEVHVDPFDGSTPLDIVSRQVLKQYDFDEIMEIMRRLHTEYRLPITQIAPMVRAEFMSSVRAHPLPYILHAVKNFVWIPPRMLVEAPRVIRLLGERNDQPFGERLRELQRGAGVRQWSQLGLEILAALASSALFVLFLLGPPLLLVRAWIRRAAPELSTLLIAVLWLTYLGITGMFAFVHMEARYLMCTLPIAIVVSLRMLQVVVPYLLRARRLQGAPEVARMPARGTPPSRRSQM